MREKKRYNLNLIACTAGVKQHCRYHTAPPWPYRLCRRTTRPGPEGRQHKQLLRAPGPYFTILHYRLLLFIYLLYRLRAQRKIFIVWTGPAHHCFNPVDVVTSSSSSFFFWAFPPPLLLDLKLNMKQKQRLEIKSYKRIKNKTNL